MQAGRFARSRFRAGTVNYPAGVPGKGILVIVSPVGARDLDREIRYADRCVSACQADGHVVRIAHQAYGLHGPSILRKFHCYGPCVPERIEAFVAHIVFRPVFQGQPLHGIADGQHGKGIEAVGLSGPYHRTASLQFIRDAHPVAVPLQRPAALAELPEEGSGLIEYEYLYLFHLLGKPILVVEVVIVAELQVEVAPAQIVMQHITGR